MLCNFNRPGSVSQMEDELPCNQPAAMALAVTDADGKQIIEVTCSAVDHYTLALDWLTGIGPVAEFALANVTGRIAS